MSTTEEIAELTELLDRLSSTLVEFEAGMETGVASRDSVHSIFRLAHNLKSSLAVAEREFASTLIHTIENILGQIRDGHIDPTADLVSGILRGVDMITDSLLADDEDANGMTELGVLIASLAEGACAENSVATLDFELSTDEIIRREAAIKKKRYLLYYREGLAFHNNK